MKGMGFTNVSVIRGGWNGWKAAGHPESTGSN
ncbi:MAG: hypothetical protein IPJ58_08780 [Ardenticatenia bacterium]|jgi:3-mercaptopyruvate sulfurtransferase SseA|nr:hypothetical protein [Ardenticatenia bacterium]MBK8538795.1 hypothetical protein [Ardenticatenia bacterium]